MEQRITKTGVLLLLLMTSIGFKVSAQKYSATESKVRFFSEATLEDIEAVNEKSKCVIRESDSSIVVLITNTLFDFEKDLMEEHFNENYMESEKYPHSIFKGKIVEGMDFSKDGSYEVIVNGTLDIHGVVLERELNGTIEKKGKELILHTVFDIKVEDHGIEVPSLYIENIAEVVEVTADFTLKLKE